MHIFPCGNPAIKESMCTAEGLQPHNNKERSRDTKKQKRFYERFQYQLLNKKQANGRSKKSLKKLNKNQEKQIDEFARMEEMIQKVTHPEVHELKQQMMRELYPVKFCPQDKNHHKHSMKYINAHHKTGTPKNKISLSREKRQFQVKQHCRNAHKNTASIEKHKMETETNEPTPFTMQSILSEQIYEDNCTKAYLANPWNYITQPKTPHGYKHQNHQKINSQTNNLHKYSLKLIKK